MSRSVEKRGQTGVETILVTGVILASLIIMSAYYFGNISDQTTAIVILKTELLEKFAALENNYVITSSLEPTILKPGTADETLCFEIYTNPRLDSEKDTQTISAATNADNGEITNKIKEQTRYKKVTILLEESCE